MSVFDHFVGLALKGLTQRHWHCVIGNRFNVKQRCSVDVLLFKFDFHYYFVSCRTWNHLQTSQTTDKPVKLPTNQPNHPQTATNQPNNPQTTQKPAKPLTNQSNIGQTTQKPAYYWQKISRKLLPKTLATMQNMC